MWREQERLTVFFTEKAGSLRKWEPAPPDPGIKPGGIRDRVMQAVLKRGPQPEDKQKIRRSQEYWAKFRAEQAKRGAAALKPDEADDTRQREPLEAGLMTPSLHAAPCYNRYSCYKSARWSRNVADVASVAGASPQPSPRRMRT